MRFTSLIVELIRARPRLTVWVVLVVQAAIWFTIPTLFYANPPGDLATVIAFGREHQVGTDLGPPLAFWLADLGYRAAGEHMAGVYFLAQLCFLATFWILFWLGRAIVGAPHAVVAVLLTMTITAFGWPGVEYGPNVLARPIWALTLLQTWRATAQNRRSGWFGLAVAAGLLLLTTADAPWLLAILAILVGAVVRGRSRLASFDPIYAILIAGTLAFPWLTWLYRTGRLGSPVAALRTGFAAIDVPTLQIIGVKAGVMLSLLLLATAGIAILCTMNAARFVRRRETPPLILRAGIDFFTRPFVYGFAIVTPVLGALISAATGRPEVVGGGGIALLMVGLAVVVGAGDAIPLRRQRNLRRMWAFIVILPALAAVISLVVVPWLTRTTQASVVPASELARFFGDSFMRRTGRPLRIVAGDPDLAALVSLGPTRPHLLVDEHPQRTPWITEARLAEIGGVVVWRATDTAGAPPPGIAQRFPDLAPEVPHAFESLLNGRQQASRIGWAIIRPKA